MKWPVIIIIFLLLFVTVADATEYTVSPSKNVGKPPGTSFHGEEVHELQPVPVWFAMILAIFPQLAVINIESFFCLKYTACAGYIKIKKTGYNPDTKKEAIYRLIKMNPGIHFRKIQRETGILKGTLEYHIKNMEHEGRVKSVKAKGKVHYFVNNSTYSAEEMKIILVMNNESLKNILSETCTKSVVTNKEIANNLELSKSSVSEKLNFLNDIGILSSKKYGWYTFYEISKEYADAVQNYFSRNGDPEQNMIVQTEKIPSF